MFTWENTWKDLEDNSVTVAVVPMGSTEQHGTNLPLCSDSISVEKVAAEIAKELGAYLVPVIPIGESKGFLGFRGTISLSPDTMKSVIADIADSLVITGFKVIIFLSIHGGNSVLWSGYLDTLEEKYNGIRIFDAGLDPAWDQASKVSGLPDAIHADECEASMIASIRPDLVGQNPIDCLTPKGGYPKGKEFREVYPSGSIGEPSKASKSKGDQFWKTFIQLAIEGVKKRINE